MRRGRKQRSGSQGWREGGLEFLTEHALDAGSEPATHKPLLLWLQSHPAGLVLLHTDAETEAHKGLATRPGPPRE